MGEAINASWMTGVKLCGQDGIWARKRGIPEKEDRMAQGKMHMCISYVMNRGRTEGEGIMQGGRKCGDQNPAKWFGSYVEYQGL